MPRYCGDFGSQDPGSEPWVSLLPHMTDLELKEAASSETQMGADKKVPLLLLQKLTVSS